MVDNDCLICVAQVGNQHQRVKAGWFGMVGRCLSRGENLRPTSPGLVPARPAAGLRFSEPPELGTSRSRPPGLPRPLAATSWCLQGCPRLRRLLLRHCGGVNDVGVRSVALRCKQLQARPGSYSSGNMEAGIV